YWRSGASQYWRFAQYRRRGRSMAPGAQVLAKRGFAVLALRAVSAAGPQYGAWGRKYRRSGASQYEVLSIGASRSMDKKSPGDEPSAIFVRFIDETLIMIDTIENALILI
ncbi:MAG: hypothetical protein K2H22_08950, partial [Muribaculaceae bacterium]|nr:hypothetical protein [Muribaculaceae bacterium]